MCARRVVLELTLERVTGCRERPSLKFVAVLAEARRGDCITLVSDEPVIPSGLALASLEEEGFVVRRFEKSGWRYTIEAIKEA